jgi:hypothetical protein
MSRTRTITAAVLLVVGAGLATLGVLFHYGLTAEYGDVTDSAVDGLVSSFSTGVGGPALVVVAAAALLALVATDRPWMRMTAAALPALMLLGMLVATPAALRHKLAVQYDATPQCLSEEDVAGPGARAARASQEAFGSIEHVGYFGGGGSSGVGGCDRSFVLVGEPVDVLAHYRSALVRSGWRVVEDDAQHLGAERDGMAFEVRLCAGGGAVWAGRVGTGGASCAAG